MSIFNKSDQKDLDAYHHGLLQSIPDDVYVISRNGIILDVHASSEVRESYPISVQVNQNILEVFPNDVFQVYMDAILKSNNLSGIQSFEYSIASEGNIYHFNAKMVSLGDDKYLVSVRDITENKNNLLRINSLLLNEEQLNESLRDFTQIVSHNLRIHSVYIQGLMDIIKESHLDFYNNQVVQMISLASNELNKTVDDLYNALNIRFSLRKSVGDCNLRQLVEKSLHGLEFISSERNVEIINQVESHIVLKTNQYYMVSIFHHLIQNGILYSDPGRPSWVKISSIQTDSIIQVVVEDNGIGIDLSRNRDKLFKMYKKLHNSKGSKGLGLYITKVQVEAMGGTIQLESKLGSGTRFIIQLPLEETDGDIPG